MNPAPLPVAILGAGKAGRQHAAALAATGASRVALVADPDETAGRALAEAHGAAWRPAFDDATGADRIVAAFAARALPLQVGFVHRFREESRMAHAWIREGRFGRPTLVSEVKPYGVQNTPAWVWRNDRGGGALLYNGIHGLDRLRWLTGLEALRAHAVGGASTHDVDVDDAIAGHLELEGGAFAQVLVQLSPFPMGGHWTTTVYGTEGAVEIHTGQGLRGWGFAGAFGLQVERCDRFAAQAKAFVRAARGDAPVEVDGHDGRAALAIALGLLDAARQGSAVAIDRGTTTEGGTA